MSGTFKFLSAKSSKGLKVYNRFFFPGRILAVHGCVDLHDISAAAFVRGAANTQISTGHFFIALAVTSFYIY